ncbi:BtrH N-terminal domain-containing protein [Ruminococcus sp.]|uniref:BtrH N-terminal domain-containing protein n=1 Tax=Ruminococcus sp. TaxID=41978 RepID=UPI0038901795
MDKILSQKTLTSPSELCFVAPYSSILRFLDIDVDDISLYCCCGGLNFRYGYIHEHRWIRDYMCDLDLISLEGSRDISNAIYERFGICFKEVLCDDRETAKKLITNQLSSGKKVVCFADAFFLKYHPQFHKNHGQTILTIWGYDSATNSFVVSDRHVTTIPISSYSGTISLPDFDLALICGENLFDGKTTGIIIYDDSCGERTISMDMDKQFVNMAYRMLSDKDERTGVNGIKTFGNDVIKWKSQWCDDRIKEVFNSAYLHIMGRGGPYISRKVYADFISRQYNDSELGGRFSALAKKWRSLSVKFFRNTLDTNKNSLQNISALIHEIAEIETGIYESIIDEFKK